MLLGIRLIFFPRVEVTDVKVVRDRYQQVSAEIISIKYQNFFFLDWNEDAVIWYKPDYISVTRPGKAFDHKRIEPAKRICEAKLALAMEKK